MELAVLLTITFIVVIIGLFYWLTKMNNNYWEKQGVPYIKSPPLVGIMKDVILMKKGMGEIFLEIYKEFDGEKIGGYFQFTSPTFIIRDPELINQVLIKDFTYFEDRSPPMNANDLFSMGISFLSGDKWRNVRHKLTPTFTSGKLKMMFEPIKECSDEVVNYIEETGEDIEARDFMLRYVLNVIGYVAFGLKLNTFNTKDEQSKEFYKMASSFFQPSMTLLVKIMIFMSLPKLRDMLKVKLMDDVVESFFKNLTNDVIKYRERKCTKQNDFLHIMLDLKNKEKEYLKNGTSSHNTVTSSTESEVFDSEDKELMDHLKNTPDGSYNSKLSEIFTDEFIASQTFLFISGGSETTAGALSFVFYQLAMNQDAQKKVHDEITNVLATQEFNYQAVRKMTYLEQCINETLRIHPVVGGLMRYCTRDYKIPGTDVVIEKGTNVNIPISGLHNDPQYFSDPDKFNPDRFEDMDAIPKGVFFPFGGGPRICIAMRLAILEMKIVVATILLNYTVIMSEKTTLPLKLAKNSFLPRPEGGMWVKFQKREV